ncbi:unnamed protein product [Lymnaea stagnalis]|uniref:Tudor domain-containing protein 7 n=1 Tax=Lymnaea stagnalis TaxID=6523 RepID=A0AAV2ILW0_LYMST
MLQGSEMEELKVEIRSLLLSTKGGISEADVSYDYKMVLGKEMPYRALGFNNVSSLLQAMPDVARKVRTPDGQIIYHAISDDSTRHIQRLVSNQKSSLKKKKPFGHGKRGRGRGGFYTGRGGVPGRGRAASGHAPSYPRGLPAKRYNSSLSSGSGDWRNKNKSASGSSMSTFFQPNSVKPIGFDGSHQQGSGKILDTAGYDGGVINYKIRVGPEDQRTITTVNGKSTEFDLREVLQKRRNNREPEKGGSGQPVGQKRIISENKEQFQRNLPPRFRRTEQAGDSASRHPFSPQNSSGLQQQYHEEKVLHLITRPNWEPPEHGKDYLEAYLDYFDRRGEVAPSIEIVEGKCYKEKGFYGRIHHNDKLYYPLEILRTKEEAGYNVARAYCVTNKIPLLPKTTYQHQQAVLDHMNPVTCNPGKTYQLEPHGQIVETSIFSTARPGGAVTPQQRSVVAGGSSPSHTPTSSPPSNNPSHTPHSPQSTSAKSPAENKQHANCDQTQTSLTDEMQVVKNIYALLTESGIFVKGLPQVYEREYHKPLDISDIMLFLKKWPDFFLLEEPFEKRFVVYPGPGISQPTHPAVPQYVLPNEGSVMDVIYSFALSAGEVYVRSAQTENTVYEIDEKLNSFCQTSSPVEVSTIRPDCLVSACYEGGWYRAQVKAVESCDKIAVYFLDYGNSEKVSPKDMRAVPMNESLLITTVPLAIKCACRKTKAGEWCEDVATVLENFAQISTVFKAKFIAIKGDSCEVDLYMPDGDLINSKLIREQVQALPLAPATPAAAKQSSVSSQAATPQQLPWDTATGAPVSHSPYVSTSTRLFADDPDPLVIPSAEEFAVYVCRVTSECSVILRFVDKEYSDSLDELEDVIQKNFDKWQSPKQIKQSNIYAAVVVEEADEEDVGEEETLEYEKYYRVRVMKEEKGQCYCYLPDHGDYETIDSKDLREIDPQLNASLAYQATSATLRGLENLETQYRAFATKILIKMLISETMPFMARRTGNHPEKQPNTSGVDPDIVKRVRKIISCMSDVEPAKVAKVYENVYKEAISNIEEVLKHIPGYGYWIESLVIDLIDTHQEFEDLNINEDVLKAVEDCASGMDPNDVLFNLFGSEASSVTTECDEVTSNGSKDASSSQEKDQLQASLNKLSLAGEVREDKNSLARVWNYLQDLDASQTQTPSSSKKSLYTWNTNTEPAASKSAISATPCSPPSVTDTSVGPVLTPNNYWSYPKLKSTPVHIISVESPSNFVSIPSGLKGDWDKLHTDLIQYYSKSEFVTPSSVTENVLYAVKCEDLYYRALYMGTIGQLYKVFLPDHHLFEAVMPSQLFSLPEQFCSLPFSAYSMSLEGVVPHGAEWDGQVKTWFINQINQKTLYAVILRENDKMSRPKGVLPPPTLVVRLIDTSGADDLVIDEFMEQQGLALREAQKS